ncbi:hypothetical protein [Mycoplasmopsis felifaucium]|uniref:Uncharacterized protein n=1 Tax=Mycoplasmopsis felifaucium TaxID=35768 RepID=A0ABZ2RT14_9BACT
METINSIPKGVINNFSSISIFTFIFLITWLASFIVFFEESNKHSTHLTDSSLFWLNLSFLIIWLLKFMIFDLSYTFTTLKSDKEITKIAILYNFMTSLWIGCLIFITYLMFISNVSWLAKTYQDLRPPLYKYNTVFLFWYPAIVIPVFIGLKLLINMIMILTEKSLKIGRKVLLILLPIYIRAY